MPAQSSADSITDDILWSDCPEELYLRRILQEQYQEEGTIADSILGRSTVEGIFSGNSGKSPPADDDDRYDGKSWLNFSPLAGSVATAPITPDDDMSPKLEKKKKGKKDKKIKQVKSSEAVPPKNDHEMNHESNIKKSLPVDVNPRFIDFDEESSTGSLRVARIPDVVDMHDPYDEEATEIDATRGGLSTLSGDTFLRNIGLQTQQPDYERTWVDVDEISYAKALEDSTGATSKSSKQDSRSDPTQADRAPSMALPKATRTSRSDSKKSSCCSRIIRIMTEDDRIFRRTVTIAVVLIVLFVSLSVFALIRSGDFFLNKSTASSSRPLPSPAATFSPSTNSTWIDPNQETDIPLLSTTGTPSFSPVQQPDEDSSVHGNEDLPTAPPTKSDPFRFVSTLINERSPDSLNLLRDEASPQNQAFMWMITDLPNTMETSDERVLQRWTLAVLFYSLGGNGWTQNDGWLTESDVCNWFTSSSEEVCNEFGLLSRLDLAQNNLQGELPLELELLSSLIEINLEGNGITGSISSKFGELRSLESLNLSYNKFSGGIPTEMGHLSNLEQLELESNDLTGTMPTEVCSITNQGLDTLTVDCAQVSCTCCDSC